METTMHGEIKRLTKGFDVDKVTYELPPSERCPNCGGPLRNYKLTEGEEPKCGPFCCFQTVDEFGRDSWETCGYKDLKSKPNASIEEKYKISVKNKTLNIFKHGSLVGNRQMLEKTLDDYKTDTYETKQAKKMAIDVVDEILQGQQPHLIYTGKAGTGKSHLANGMARALMEKSNYRKQALVVSYSEFYSQYKEAINIPELVRLKINPLMTEIKKADLLVIDDLGADLGRLDAKTVATNYNVELLQRICEIRTDKATVFTTNLTAKQIKVMYGDRIYSRIMSNTKRPDGSLRVVKFDETIDNRSMSLF